MKSRNMKLVFVALVSCPWALGVEDARSEIKQEEARSRMVEVKDKTKFHSLVDVSAEVYRSLVKGPHGEVPVHVQDNAQCIAVIPNVMTGAILLGGTRGEGLVSCKNADDNWSQVAPVSLSQGSIGLQAGIKSADLILFIQSDEAVRALKRGEYTMGADAGVVAGTFDKSLDTEKAGVLVYSRAAGLFVGASVNGSTLGKNEGEIEKFYGRKVDHTALLEGRVSPDLEGYSMKLTKLLP